ncbi:hypothetical protein IQ241_10270 [Romeria aff. gracilis LEGE 07310]|uniref:Uncharacterized protein n=1 Tax=Vasconcelosia minhoensis LEGE 07310 TaxID=915328 RepID=A0A8J7DLT9_9CYAN|nr:hypothetical protein [Romeria aff. gracilis LEGE 07310]
MADSPSALATRCKSPGNCYENPIYLRLQDMAAADIDQVLGLTARQRDYLQQRFKYHVQRFAQFHSWELVHQWLGADLEKNFGLTPQAWQRFLAQLNPAQRQLLELRQQAQRSELPDGLNAIAQRLGQTPKQVRRSWSQIVSLAWQLRNSADR